MSTTPERRVRFRFAGFTLAPARRQLLRDGAELPLIPRYLDLLILLVERRHEAVARRDILDRVWSDVVVSDGALSQAVRTLRRTLGDDPREPVFIRTVSRHGYLFTFLDVIEEPDDAERAAPEPEPIGAAVETLLRDDVPEEDRRAAAETLHVLGTGAALERVATRPGHERALALLRDARWAVPGAGDVPLLGRAGGLRAARILVGMRLRLAARLVAARWGGAAVGGAAAGCLAGAVGGILLLAAAGADRPASLPLAFGLAGGLMGGWGAAGVGAGLAVAEALARSARGTALVACGAIGGGLAGALAHLAAVSVLEGLFGHFMPSLGGGLEGLVIGGAAGLGYALSTPRPGGGGMASPRGAARLRTAALTGACCAAAAVLLTLAGRRLGAASLDLLAKSFPGSRAGLDAIGALLGETGFGRASHVLLAACEGAIFGLGLAYGLTRRPRG